jgi:hypothetical protein
MEERRQENQPAEGLNDDALRLLQKSLMKAIDEYAFPFNVLGKGESSK